MPFKDPERAKSYRHEYYKKYYQKNKETYRNANYKHKYGITTEQYDKMYSEQKGKCAICEQHEQRLCVDHNHTTGKVRQLLCKLCNTQLNLVEGRYNLIDKMKQYLLINSTKL